MPHWTDRLRDWTVSVRDLVIPHACVVCNRVIATAPETVPVSVAICEACREALRGTFLSQCSRCGAHLNISGGEPRLEDCRHCRGLALEFNSVTCLGNYDGALRGVVRKLKCRYQDALAIQLGRWLAWQVNQEMACVARARPQSETASRPLIVVPVPVYWSRRLRRGYHVPELLAEGIAAGLSGSAHVRPLLQSVRPTRKQGTLSTPQRFRNVKDAFAARPRGNLSESDLVLVDDVMTSGATAIEALRCLRSHGAGQVHLCLVARGVGLGGS